MERRFKQGLPDRISEIVDEIEQFLGQDIEVDFDADPPREPRFNPQGLSCSYTESGATILIRDMNYFPPTSVLHELLHIRRFSIEQVPQLDFCENQLNPDMGDLDSWLGSLDNYLEHLVIVPIEVEIAPERLQYWKEWMRSFWDSYLSKAKGDEEHSIKGVLIWGAMEATVPDEAIKGKAESCLRSLKLWEEAAALAGGLIRHRNSKERVSKLALRCLFR